MSKDTSSDTSSSTSPGPASSCLLTWQTMRSPLYRRSHMKSSKHMWNTCIKAVSWLQWLSNQLTEHLAKSLPTMVQWNSADALCRWQNAPSLFCWKSVFHSFIVQMVKRQMTSKRREAKDIRRQYASAPGEQRIMSTRQKLLSSS